MVSAITVLEPLQIIWTGPVFADVILVRGKVIPSNLPYDRNPRVSYESVSHVMDTGVAGTIAANEATASHQCGSKKTQFSNYNMGHTLVTYKVTWAR